LSFKLFSDITQHQFRTFNENAVTFSHSVQIQHVSNYLLYLLNSFVSVATKTEMSEKNYDE